MKKKDLIYALLAVVIMLVAGYIAYTQLIPKKSSADVVEVEKIGVIPSSVDATGLKALDQVVDYNSVVDLHSLGNPAPFGR